MTRERVTTYDLVYETADAATYLVHPRGHPWPSRARPSTRPNGWAGQHGPGVDPTTWPRSPQTGLPMRHLLTLWLPPEYLRRGPGLPGIAFFQGQTGDDLDRATGQAGSDDPFLADLAHARTHPRLEPRVPEFDARHFALLWLTAAELAPGPTPPPPDPRRAGEHRGVGPNAWDAPTPLRRIWLEPRVDRNSGLAPTAVPIADNPYQPALDPYTEEREPWAEAIADRDHLGGTCVPIQLHPEGLSPYYLELSSSAGLDLATSYAANGRVQLDLETDVFNWET